jgi:regulator of protease activity HflC (stomatin/prohibitin superfamily)
MMTDLLRVLASAVLFLILALAAASVIAMVAGRIARRVVVRAWETALVYRDGAFDRVLPPGAHRLFDPLRRVTVVTLPSGEQGGELGPIEVYAKEGFAFRLTLAWTYRIADPRAFHEVVAGSPYARGRPPGFDAGLTAAAMAAAAARPLADMIADPQPVAAEALAAVAPAFPVLALANASVLRLQLPPEVRRLFTEVEAARLQGLAALERARGEQTALRSLANAARLIRDNPELAQLRLLHTIENAKRPATIVMSQQPVAVAPAPD